MRLLGPLPGDVLEVVSEMTGIRERELFKPWGAPRVNAARHIVCWVSKQFGASYPEIAEYMGRDHSTIQASVQRVEADSTLKALAMDVAENVQERFGATPDLSAGMARPSKVRA